MTFGVQEHIEDQIALSRSFQPGAFEVLVEDIRLFAFHEDHYSARLYTGEWRWQISGGKARGLKTAPSAISILTSS